MIRLDTYGSPHPRITVDEEGLAALATVVEMLQSLGVDSPVHHICFGSGDRLVELHLETTAETEEREREEVEDKARSKLTGVAAGLVSKSSSTK